MSLKIACRIWLLTVLTAGLYVSLGSASCSNNSALPQASIPAPANDCGDSGSTACVTVSSPDSEGFVTITGAEGAVPESATVEIRVSGAVSLLRWLDNLCPSAYASSCTSDLPECSSDGATEDCHTTANSDGSFTVRIEAAVDNTISIVYLDIDTCEPSEAYETAVTNSGLISLDFEGVALSYVSSTGEGVVFGVDSSGAYKVAFVSQEGDINSTITMEGLSGDVNRGGYLPNHDYYLFVTTNSTYRASTSASPVRVMINDANPEGVAVQENFEYPSSETDPDYSSRDMTCLSTRFSGASFLGETVDRVFIPATAEMIAASPTIPFYVLDPANDPVSADNIQEAQAVSFEFTDYSSALEGFTLQAVEQIYISENGDTGFFMGFFSDGSASRYFLVEIPMAQGFCNQVDSDTLSGPIVLEMPEEMSSPGETFFVGALFEALGEDALEEETFMIPDSESDLVAAVSLDDVLVTEISLDELSDSLGGMTETVRILLPGETPHRYAGINSRALLNFFDVSESLELSAVATDVEIGIHPVDMQFVTSVDFTSDELSADTLNSDIQSNSSLMILSQGLEDDGLSFLKIINYTEFSEF